MITLRDVHVLKPDVEAGVTAAHVRGLAESYGKNGHRAPIVIGHPQDNHPAWGWVTQCRLAEGDNLKCDIDVAPEFKELLDLGHFRERSVAFYPTDPPALRHIGFLGAVPPKVKGLEAINLSEGIETYMTQDTQLTAPAVTPAPSAPESTAAPVPVMNLAEVTRPVALFALSKVLPGVKANDLSTEPVISGESISGLVELSDGKSYSYNIKKEGNDWKASYELRNPEVITLSEQVAELKGKLAMQSAAAVVGNIYSNHKLTEAILPREACVELIALSEGTKVGDHLKTLLGNLPSLVSAAPVASTPTEAAVATTIPGFNGFELSDTKEYNQVVAKCIEMKLNPNKNEDFMTALHALNL